jgi:beta-lactamase regulating signal transducer with metallopeptidase domain
MNSFIEILNQWGGNFLSFAWPMLWQSSLLITALFVFDLLLRRKLRTSIRYALWLIVLVKLCVPPTLALPTSPVWWLHKTPPSVVAKPSRHYMITYDEGPLSEMPQIPLPAFVPPQPAMTNAAWLLAVSAAVSSALLIWLLARWWQITRLVRRAAASERLTAISDAAQKFVGLNLKVQVKLTTNAMSPAVCGLFRPAILIPQSLAENFTDEQLHAVLLHELIHLRRRDVWLNFVQALLQIIYWWHPLVWLANAHIRRVREEAVDDAVMLALRNDAESYAPTLLEVAKLALNRPLASLGLVGILESRHALRQRIERLVDFRPPRHAGLTLVSLLGILAFTAVAVPMGDGPSPEETQTLPVAPVPTPKPIEQKTNLPSVLIQGFIYQMRDVDFDKIVSGLKFNPAETGRDPWWSASPEKFSQLMENLKSSGLQPITRPRIQTSSGIPASMYFGDGTNGLEFDCSPIVVGGIVDLTIQGKFVDAKGSEAVTNEFNAKTSIDNYGGIVIRTKNIGGSGESNVVVITGVQLVTNIPTSLYQQIMPARTTNVTGVLTDPNFRTALRALTEQQGVESLAEPEVVTSSGHGINKITTTSISAPVAKMDAGQLVQDGKLLYEMGKLDEAEVKLKAALALEPENAAAKYYLGLVQAARQHSTIHQTKTGRQSIADKLEQIRLPLFGPFMAANLGDAVRQLNEMARQNDPEKTGVNFVILTNSLSSQPAGIDSVIINLTVPLMNVTLGDALDAMTLVTDKPIKYSILDDMIVLSMKDGSDIPALYSRHFRIDANTFIAAMQNASGIKTNNIPAMAKDFFKTLGVDLDVPGKSVFYGDRLGELFVRATKQDLDTIESSMKPFISVAPQIHIKARFLEVPKGTLDGLENVIAVTNPPALSNQVAGLTGILTAKNFKSVLHNLEARPDVETLAEPEVVTTSGRQTYMRETVISTIITNFVFEENLTNSWFRPQTSPIETGSKLDVIPIVLADGITIYLQTTASQTEFLGYAHIPKNTPLHSVTNSAGEEIDLPLIWPAMQISRESAHVNLHDGQTLILSQNRPEQIRFGEPDPKREAVVAKHIRDSQKKNKGGAREIIVFVTATFVDPAGNRIHSDEDLPFAKDSIPSQPK